MIYIRHKKREKKILKRSISELGLDNLDEFTPKKELLKLVGYAYSAGFSAGWDRDDSVQTNHYHDEY
jgi:hypothetical protein